MNNTLSALRRFSAVAGLCLLLAILIPLHWLIAKVSGGSLAAAEWAKRELARLWGAK